MLRRLRLPADEPLIREAYRWDEDRPRWWREMDLVFNSGTEDDFVAKVCDLSTAFIGVFEKDEHADTLSMIAMIIIETPAPLIHEGHLCAKRGADTVKVRTACVALIGDLFCLGMTQAVVWVAERNTGVRNLCVSIGMQPDGVAMWRGSYRGRVIKWLRHSIQREQLLINMAT